MKQPRTPTKLTVVIAYCGNEAHLRLCLQALAYQDLPLDIWDVLVVASKETPVASLVQEFQQVLHIRELLVPAKSFPTPSLFYNLGAQHAETPLLIFMTSDTLFCSADNIRPILSLPDFPLSVRGVIRWPRVLLTPLETALLNQNAGFSVLTKLYYKHLASELPYIGPLAARRQDVVLVGGFSQWYRSAAAVETDFLSRLQRNNIAAAIAIGSCCLLCHDIPELYREDLTDWVRLREMFRRNRSIALHAGDDASLLKLRGHIFMPPREDDVQIQAETLKCCRFTGALRLHPHFVAGSILTLTDEAFNPVLTLSVSGDRKFFFTSHQKTSAVDTKGFHDLSFTSVHGKTLMSVNGLRSKEELLPEWEKVRYFILGTHPWLKRTKTDARMVTWYDTSLISG